LRAARQRVIAGKLRGGRSNGGKSRGGVASTRTIYAHRSRAPA
jgi:hypothetical protein